MFPSLPHAHVKVDLPIREIAVLAIEGQLSRGAGLPGPMKLIYLEEEQSVGDPAAPGSGRKYSI